MDQTAWNEGWWCDYDGKKISWHTNTEHQFKHVAQKKKEGKNIQLVWLDIKHPNYSDIDDEKGVVYSRACPFSSQGTDPPL